MRSPQPHLPPNPSPVRDRMELDSLDKESYDKVVGAVPSGRLEKGLWVWMQGPWTRSWPARGRHQEWTVREGVGAGSNHGWRGSRARRRNMDLARPRAPASITGHMPRVTRPSLHRPRVGATLCGMEHGCPQSKGGAGTRAPGPEGLHGKQLFSPQTRDVLSTQHTPVVCLLWARH